MLRPLCGRPNPYLPGCSRWFSAPILPAHAVPPETPAPAPFRPPTPLPPSLPYSVPSRPFQTHLHILSLALVHSPDASWEIYVALHGTLRPYLPGDTLYAIIDHQCEPSEGQLKQRWSRLKTLMDHAKKAKLPLGPERSQRILAYGLKYVLGPRTDYLETNAQLLKALWKSIVPTDPALRQDYVLFNLRLHGQLRAFDIIEELVEAGYEEGLEGLAGVTLVPKLITWTSVRPDLYRQAIRRIGWLWTRGVRISQKHAVKALLEFAELPNGLAEAAKAVRKLACELRDGEEEEGAAFLEMALSSAKHELKSPALKLAVAYTHLSPEATEAALSQLLTKPVSIEATQTASLLLAQLRALPDPPDTERHHTKLIDAIATHLPSPQALDILSTLAQHLIEPKVLQTLNPKTVRHLVSLCINSLVHLRTAAFLTVTKQLYDAARPIWNWNPTIKHLFGKFLVAVVARPFVQTIFASRLYTDASADGLKVSQQALLELIRAHGRTYAAQSSAAFTERYLQDYLFAGYPITPELGFAIVQGPTEASNGPASQKAFELCQRVFGSQVVPWDVHETVMKATCRDKKLQRWTVEHLQTMIHHGPAPSLGCFEAAIYALIGHSQGQGGANLGSAVAFFRQMIQLELQPSSLTMSYLVLGLLDAKRLDAALKLFYTAKLPLKSRAVGRLMVHLALVGRQDDARSVEEYWRRLAPSAYDRAVTGARILVDAAPIEPFRGWKPSRSFREFLESRRIEPDEVEKPVETHQLSVEVTQPLTTPDEEGEHMEAEKVSASANHAVTT